MNDIERNGFYLGAAMHPETKWIYDIAIERMKQDEQWGGIEHDDQHGARDWSKFLREHVGRLNNFHIDDIQTYMGPVDDIVYDGPAIDYRDRLVKIAALAVAALESYDRKTAKQ